MSDEYRQAVPGNVVDNNLAWDMAHAEKPIRDRLLEEAKMAAAIVERGELNPSQKEWETYMKERTREKDQAWSSKLDSRGRMVIIQNRPKETSSQSDTITSLALTVNGPLLLKAYSGLINAGYGENWPGLDAKNCYQLTELAQQGAEMGEKANAVSDALTIEARTGEDQYAVYAFPRTPAFIERWSREVNLPAHLDFAQKKLTEKAVKETAAKATKLSI